MSRTRNWRRPLTYLPRSWRLTEREELTLDVLVRNASNRVKIRRNFERFGRGGSRLEAAVLDEVVDVLDSVRAR